jgi:hypothetical protein
MKPPIKAEVTRRLRYITQCRRHICLPRLRPPCLASMFQFQSPIMAVVLMLSQSSAPVYPYNSSATSASASPPGASYAALPATSSERGPADAEYTVPCPYRCGTVLTGVHALGNLTRHLKTQACEGSSRTKVRYPCPIEGCGRQYARSDGMRVHMRRRHGYPPPVPRNDGTVDVDDG